MLQRFSRFFLLFSLFTLVLSSCQEDVDPVLPIAQPHQEVTLRLKAMIDADPELRRLVEKTLAQGAAINPDPDYNPAQDLESLYDFLDWSTTCMPWDCLPPNDYPSLYSRIDQSTGYFWFIFDQPLDELKDLGYYYPSLHYHEPIASWERDYSKTWGAFLDTPESWNDDYYRMALADPNFGLEGDLYEDPSHWHTFNEFFARSYRDIDHSRPVGQAEIVAPAESWFQGQWPIDADSQLPQSIAVKSVGLTSIRQLIGEDSQYCDSFALGTFMHTFLDINCYHRFHTPISGTVREVRLIPGANAGGGITTWDAANRRYVYLNETGFQMIETRACVIIDTDQYGLVAMLPIGMSQICSVIIDPSIRPGQKLQKGDEIGFFAFGGSDICLIFQSDVNAVPLAEPDPEGGYQLSPVRSDFVHLEHL